MRRSIQTPAVVFTDLDILSGDVVGMATRKARVCNRGTNPVHDGVIVEVRSDEAVDTRDCL